jgi:undecaprenyl pyrophosphate phosphatase UppP
MKVKPEEQKTGRPSRVNDFLKYSSLGLQLVISLAIAGVLGYYIDQWIGWQFPVFLLLLVMLTLTGQIYLLIKRTND